MCTWPTEIASKNKKIALFDFGVTNCKITNKWQKEGCLTTSVPVDPEWVQYKKVTKVKNVRSYP